MTTSGLTPQAAFLRRAVFQRVVDQISDRLADQLAVSADPQRALGLDPQRDALLLRDRLVELGDAAGGFAEVECLNRIGIAAGLGARDQQKRVEDLDQTVGFLDRLFEGGSIGGGVAAEGERRFGVVAQAGERRAQVVRDVVGHLAQALHEIADPREHLVEALRQPVELVAGAGNRQPSGQVARHDAVRRGVDVVDALEHAPGDEQRADRRERGEEDQRDRQRPHHDFLDPAAIAEIVPDKKNEPGRKPVDAHERLVGPVAANVGAIEDVDEAGPLEHPEGDLLDIAGKRLTRRVGQQIERRAGLPLAHFDHGVEPHQTLAVVGVGEALGLGVDRPGHLLVDDRDDLPGDRGQYDAGADGAEGQNRQREAKGGGAEEFTERRHESCIPRRVRC